MRTYRYLILPIFTVLVVALAGGCGNPNGTILHLRYQYTHATVPNHTQVEDHFGTGVVIGDSQSWVNEKWGKPTKINSGSGKNQTVTYSNATVSYTNGRVSSIEEKSKKPCSLKKALSTVTSLLPPDSRVVTKHQAGSTPDECVYEYQSASLANLVDTNVWPDNPYEVAGKVYITLTGNSGVRKVTDIRLDIQSPNVI